MGLFTAVALAAGAIGSLASVAGSVISADAQTKQERLREKQMGLENIRRQREIIRQGQAARAQALAAATSQGAQYGSGLQGGYGGISGATGRQAVAANQNFQIGSDVFAAGRQNAQGGTIANIGGGLQSFSQSLLSNYGSFERIGWVG